MPNFAIRVNNLGKMYRIGAAQKRHDTLSDKIIDFGSQAINLCRRKVQSYDTIYALKDVSFEVKRGEIVGIIGRNGAGKSTLLKILSGITEPTQGSVDIQGKVGSLLEVGTGFHPELTGRENIYLNGAILGMKKSEITRKFDKIVAFSEIGKFLDTPVKRYSSGMHVRLAFAVSAHLDPEILLIDEVLAVGDYSFQRKCLDKMRDVSKQGRTTLFISHNMMAITNLCSRTVLLDQGKLLRDGPSWQVVNEYLDSGLGAIPEREWSDINKAPGNEIIRLRAVRVYGENGLVVDTIDVQQSFKILMEYDVLSPGHVLVPNYHFYNEEGMLLFVVCDQNSGWTRQPRQKGHYVSTICIPGNLFSECNLSIWVAMSTMEPVAVHFCEHDSLIIRIVENLKNNPTRGDYVGKIPGAIRPLFKWETQLIPAKTVLI